MSEARTAPPADPVDVAVIGAGIAGLVAARALAAAGRRVVVLERSRGPGGRLATRAVDGAMLDSGAQFFTVRSDVFSGMVGAWTQEGCPVTVWGKGFAKASAVGDGPEAATSGADGHDRHAVAGGMNVLAGHLARGLDVRCGLAVRAVAPGPGGWQVLLGVGDRLDARAVVCTPPVPQTLALLASGGVALGPLADRLRQLRFDPCLALLATFDRPLVLPQPGGVQLAAEPITWLADNVAKGASREPGLTVHAGPAWSAAHFDDDDDTVAGQLLELVSPWTAPAAARTAEIKRWRHSRPTGAYPERCAVVDGSQGPLVLAGDAFGEAKVEGAARSGAAAAEQVLARLS
jgi:predicted NAD/FAD-dependent oxidoreductase